MLKKLAMGVAATAAFGLCTGALAGSPDQPNNSGIYVRGEAGYGWAASKSDQVIAFPAGTIAPLGVQPTISTNNKKSHGFTGRVAVGYDFNQYLGVESGFTWFHPAYRTLTFVGAPAVAGTTTGSTKTSLYAVDLMGKATIPFNNFYAFVEGGAAYVHVKHSALSANFIGTPVNFWQSGSKGFVRPKVGAGIGYNISSNLAVDVSYARIFGKGSITNPNYLPNLNTTTVGLTYKF